MNFVKAGLLDVGTNIRICITHKEHTGIIYHKNSRYVHIYVWGNKPIKVKNTEVLRIAENNQVKYKVYNVIYNEKHYSGIYTSSIDGSNQYIAEIIDIEKAICTTSKHLNNHDHREIIKIIGFKIKLGL